MIVQTKSTLMEKLKERSEMCIFRTAEWPRYSLITLSILASMVLEPHAWGQAFSYRGELTGMASQMEDQTGSDWLMRYLPEIKIQAAKEAEEDQWSWDANLAAYLYAYDSLSQGQDQDAEVFRAWVRLYDETTEYRIGLQELSFGPAILLRSLQWFDSKNPLDPTSFTKGVKGALVRFSTENDSTYWVWALYGNEDLTAATRFVSDAEKPESGGRAQFSSEIAEYAVTLHQRQAVLSGQGSVDERRLGLDLKLDLAYNGLWLESMIIERAADLPYPNQERYVTLGLDYTVDMTENGIVLTCERNWGEAKTAARDFTASTGNTALMASLSSGLLDSYVVTLMKSEIPESNLIRFDWQRTYDDFLWNLSLFQSQGGVAPAQFGLGLIVQYNH